MTKFPDFKGVLIYGSFAKGKREYNDIDLNPVLTHFKPTQDNMKRLHAMEDEIHKHMPPTSGKGRKESQASSSFAHFSITSDMVILDELKYVHNWGTGFEQLWTFVGDAEIKKKLIKLMGAGL